MDENYGRSFISLKGKLTRRSGCASDYEAGFIAGLFSLQRRNTFRLTDRLLQASLHRK
jgi:hypothetical protein